MQVSPAGYVDDIRDLHRARQGMVEGFKIMTKAIERLSETYVEGHLALVRLHSVAAGESLFDGQDADDERDVQERIG